MEERSEGDKGLCYHNLTHEYAEEPNWYSGKNKELEKKILGLSFNPDTLSSCGSEQVT